MPDNIQRNTGRPKNYKTDRGNVPNDPGPFIGVVKNNIDPTFAGRVQVYIEAFGGGDPNDQSLWRTVRYMSPFYGVTDPRLQDNYSPQPGVGGYETNPQSYGMWMMPPDLGVNVLCFFVEGDPNQGYYVGCIPEQGLNHMVPAVGASTKFEKTTAVDKAYFGKDPQMSVVEINAYNPELVKNPQFFDQTKPMHRYVAATLFQQGINGDVKRGPISSSSQRETPSTVYGFSTPGRPIYNGGLQPETIKKQLAAGTLSPTDVKVIARQGGHSVVLDDGTLDGQDALVRIRSAKGHQIMMNDEGNFFYIIHANGLTWIELGKEGTVDIFSTNSVNVRTKGTINLHADEDINMYAGGNIAIKSNKSTQIQSQTSMTLQSVDDMTVYSKKTVGIRSDGTLALQADSGSWKNNGNLSLRAGRIDLNGGSAATVNQPPKITKTLLSDTTFNSSQGWIVKPNSLESIVTRAPTHEPYPYHNEGVNVKINLESGQAPTPNAVAVPTGVTITRTS